MQENLVIMSAYEDFHERTIKSIFYSFKHSNHYHGRCYLKEKIHEKIMVQKKLNTTEPCGCLLLDKDFRPHLYVQ